MDTEMELTLIIVWFAGIVCGTGFFTGIGVFLYYIWKKMYQRLVFPFISMAIGFAGMSYSLFTLLRLVRTWIVT